MSSNVTLSAGVRANLLSLQNTAQLMQTTQNRLATGKRVNSALDNPLNFFTSASLGARANDLSGLLDSMSNGIQTIQAANNGLTAVTSLVQQLQATVLQARSDASSGTVAATPGTNVATNANSSTQTNNEMTFDIGGGVTVAVSTYNQINAVVSTTTSSGAVATGDLSLAALSIDDGNGADAITFAGTDDTLTEKVAAINASLLAAGSTVIASEVGTELRLTNNTGDTITVAADAASIADLGFTNGQVSTDGAVETSVAFTNAELAVAINTNAQLAGKVSATITGTDLTINNLSTTTAITVTGLDDTGNVVTGDATDVTNIAAGTGGTLSNVRQSLLTQFNSLRAQIDSATADAGYNGINLLNADTLKLYFNEYGTSSIDVQATDAQGNGMAINSTTLGINASTASVFADNTQLDTLSTTLTTALTSLRTQASALGSSLSVVQTRQDFTKNMINTLQSGADNLILADTNEEGANLLALQTRQSLSTTALSLSAQADQAVLSLFQ